MNVMCGCIIQFNIIHYTGKKFRKGFAQNTSPLCAAVVNCVQSKVDKSCLICLQL
jgi:hypothetical protein